MWLCWVGDAAAAAAADDADGCGLPLGLCSVCVFGQSCAAAVGVTLRSISCLTSSPLLPYFSSIITVFRFTYSVRFIFYCAVFAHANEAAVGMFVMNR
jgi:hypothetical protein